MSVAVTAAPMFDPGAGRIRMELAEGATISEIIAAALPDLDRRDWRFLRVTLVTASGASVVSHAVFDRLRPRPGVHVVLRLIPRIDALKSVLTIIVTIAAVALGQFWAPAFGLGAFGTKLVAAGITIGLTALGSLLINALIPPPSQERDRPTYFINGWKNRVDPGGVVPEVYGKMRFAPPFAVPPYTEVVGDIQYVRCAFLIGYGGEHGLELSDLRLGDTPLTDYDEVRTQTRKGLVGDARLTLIREQVAEQSVGADLTRPRPRNDRGDIIDGDAISTPVTRTTGADASEACVILGWPAGLGRVNDEGEKRGLSVDIKISQSPAGLDDWEEVTTLTITARKMEAMYRSYRWELPARGRYDIRLERMTPEHTRTQQQSRTTWVALQTIRPEYPIASPFPLALVAMRIKATYQLNGALDNFNLIASRRAKDWDAPSQSWVIRETQSPAAAFRHALQSDSNPKPVADDDIALADIAAWSEYCGSKGLKYNAVHDDAKTLRERLADIASAGRAVQRHDGVAWSVIVDRPQDLIVDEISPRNSAGFKVSRTYLDPPDGFRVRFLDESNDYKSAERVVPWPGHTGDVILTEELTLPGKTNPEEIWVEARRRMYETIHRPDVYTVRQDGPVRAATRGDLVTCSHHVLASTQVAAMVRSVDDDTIELDETVTIEAGKDYGIRFRVFDGADDTIGDSVLYALRRDVGETRFVRMSSQAGSVRPVVGSHVFFGEIATISNQLIVTRIEAGDDFSAHLRLVDAATEIDEKTDAEVAPAWSGRAGDDVSYDAESPPKPVITNIESGLAETGVAGRIIVSVEPGSGDTPTRKYRVQHRHYGDTDWSGVDVSVAAGGAIISGYGTLDQVEIRVIALAKDGTPSAPTAIVLITVGANDASVPDQIDAGGVVVTALFGGASIKFETTDDASTTRVQLYRSTGSVVDLDNDATGDPISVKRSRTYTTQDGDATRTNLVTNGEFDTSSGWTLDAGWSIAGGKATHASGSAGQIAQNLTLTAGKTYRIAYTVSGRTTGSITPRLAGGPVVSGPAVSANGQASAALVAASGNTRVEFAASADFNGSIDSIVVFRQTASCLAAGAYNYWLEPLNKDGLAGPVAGPFPVTIR